MCRQCVPGHFFSPSNGLGTRLYARIPILLLNHMNMYTLTHELTPQYPVAVAQSVRVVTPVKVERVDVAHASVKAVMVPHASVTLQSASVPKVAVLNSAPNAVSTFLLLFFLFFFNLHVLQD